MASTARKIQPGPVMPGMNFFIISLFRESILLSASAFVISSALKQLSLSDVAPKRNAVPSIEHQTPDYSRGSLRYAISAMHRKPPHIPPIRVGDTPSSSPTIVTRQAMTIPTAVTMPNRRLKAARLVIFAHRIPFRREEAYDLELSLSP
jgi:hypothetical protein